MVLFVEIKIGKSNQFFFQHFKEKGEAQQAIKHLNNTEFRKKKIHVKVSTEVKHLNQ